MYQNAFGLRTKPFGNTPDPEFFYFSMDHREALVTVGQGIRDRCGLMLLVGQVGTGKSTVCYHIHKHDGYLSTYLNNPYVTEIEFLKKVNRGLGIPVGGESRMSLIEELESTLLRQYYQGKAVVLIVDEAHRLGVSVFDQILTLSNLQVPAAHLLQIILAGNTSLLATLRHPRLKSLNQRITVRCDLGRMDYADTHNYVNFRLARAGCTGHSLFTAKSLDTIWKASGGTPRLINQLCENALNAACHKGKKRVERREVKQAVNDPLYQPMFISEAKSWSMRTGFAGTVLALFFGLSFGVWYFGIGNKFLPETTTAVSHLAAEQRTLIKKPMILPSLAKKGGNEPVNTGAIVEGATLPVRVSGEAVTVEPESQTPRTTHSASPLEHFRKDLGSSTQMLATDDLPGLKLSAIAWHEDPARCIAVVNDRIVHEGDFLGEVRVLRIKPDHIVMIYGNEHIIKGIHTREDDQNPESPADQVNGEEQESKVSERNNQDNAEQSLPLNNFRAIVNFDFKTSALAPEASQELDRVASLAQQSSDHEIIIFGYTDSVGSREYNKRLSESRANIVATYLVEKGIDPERIEIIGMGDKNPVMPNSTPEGRAANRRVEIELVPAEDYSDSLAGG